MAAVTTTVLQETKPGDWPSCDKLRGKSSSSISMTYSILPNIQSLILYASTVDH